MSYGGDTVLSGRNERTLQRKLSVIHKGRVVMYLPKRRSTSATLHGIKPYKTAVLKLLFSAPIDMAYNVLAVFL